MPFRLLSHPERVGAKDIKGLPLPARPQVMAALRDLQRFGPSPEGRDVKPLGATVGGLWQLSLKVQKQQIRILYFPSGNDIVLVSIFHKTSPQEQQHAYEVAVDRKKQAEKILAKDSDGLTNYH